MKESEQTLFIAAEKGDIAAVESHLAQGTSVNAKNDYNETILITVAIKKNLPLLKKVLERDDVDLHTQGHLTGTALTFAIFSNETEIAKELLDKEKSFKNNEHPGAVNWAVLNNNKEILKLLMLKGANINIPGLTDYEESPDWVWKPQPHPLATPFHPEHIEKIQLTPLCLAIYNTNHDMLELLLKECQANPNQPNDNGALPLQIAAERNDEKAVQLLLQYGANPQLKENEDGNSNIPSYLRGKKLQINQNIKTRIEIAKKEKVFPEMLLEFYKDNFNIAYSELFLESKVSSTDKKILKDILLEGKINITELIALSQGIMLIPETLLTSLTALYCGLHPEKWEDTSSTVTYVKKILLKNTVENSLSSDNLLTKNEEYTGILKSIAKQCCTDLFSNISEDLTEAEKTKKESLITQSKTPELLSPNTSPPPSPRSPFEIYANTYTAELPIIAKQLTIDINLNINPVQTFLPNSLPKNCYDLLTSTSQQWQEIYNLIKLPQSYHRLRPQNQMFNVIKAILIKEEKRCSWGTAQMEAGCSVSANYYYNCWSREGKLQKIFSIVAQLSSSNSHAITSSSSSSSSHTPFDFFNSSSKSSFTSTQTTTSNPAYGSSLTPENK